MTTKRMTIGIDIDGTLTHSGYFIPFLNKHFNKNIDMKTIKIYDFAELYEVTNEDLYNYFVTEGKDVMFEVPLLSDAQRIVKKLSENHDIYIISARREEAYDRTYKWLQDVGLGGIKLYCLGSPKKAELAKELKCDYFFEDHPTASINIAEEGIKVLLMDAPYNQETNHENMTRVFSWNEIEKVLEDNKLL